MIRRLGWPSAGARRRNTGTCYYGTNELFCSERDCPQVSPRSLSLGGATKCPHLRRRQGRMDSLLSQWWREASGHRVGRAAVPMDCCLFIQSCCFFLWAFIVGTFNIAGCVCVLAGWIEPLLSLILWQVSQFLLPGSSWEWLHLPSLTRTFPAVKTGACMWCVLTKGLMIIWWAPPRELGVPASYFLKGRWKKNLFYSCLIFPLWCFAGLSKRY